jgi:aspartyl-tRNA(Asn)/glutamyl-tRNA(Gln) amidotransferase subunit A
MDFRHQSVKVLAERVRSRELSACEVVGHSLERIDTLNGKVNAFVAVDADAAMRAAELLDERITRGEDPGPLAGIPIGVKDLEDAAGFPTTKGSAFLGVNDPPTSDSALVARLKAAGCVVVGKTNTPELGARAETDNALFGATHNPWNLDHVPGGSSGGSAAAIAAGMVPLATGSDGGGSIRIPSSACGLSGMKTSYGRIALGGRAAPDWPALSTRGPMARLMGDIVRALDVCVGPEATDLWSLPRPDVPWLHVLDEPKMPMRVAWSPTLGYAPLDPEVREICESAVGLLEGLGAEVMVEEEVFPEDPVFSWLSLVAVYTLRTIEAAGERDQSLLDPFLRMQLDIARGITAVDFVRAGDRCHELNLRLVQLFRRVRLLVTPTCAAPPPRIGEVPTIDGRQDPNWPRFTYPFNMTRSPAATVCAGFTKSGLPVGLQLVGPQHADQVVLRSAVALEAALGLDPVAPLG